MSRPVVIFLQNAWVKEGTSPRHLKMYREDPDFRRKVLSMSMTGRRLLRAFGEEWFNRIWWDNASPEAAIGNHRGLKEFDPAHMAQVLSSQNFAAVGLLGTNAWEGFKRVPDVTLTMDSSMIRMPSEKVAEWKGSPVFRGRHPNAMGIMRHEISEFARNIIEVAR